VAALLEELDAESGDSSSPEAIAAAIEKEYDFAIDEQDLYVPLVALAFASLRWEEEIVFKIFNNLLSEFESIANNPLTPQMMRLMFMTIRGAILGNDPRQELLRHIALLPSESRELAQAVMNGEETPRGVEYSSYSTLRDLREVLELLASKSTFKEVYAALSDHNGDAKQWQTAKKVLLAVMAGGVFGIHRIPSELATYVQVFEDTQNGLEVYTLPDLQDLALTLAGFSPIKDTPPEAPLGPKKVDQNVYAGNLDGVANAMRQLGFPDDWAVLSLCRPQGRFDGLRFRRLFYLIDKKGSINPDLAAIVQDAVDEIDQHLAEGRKVVVHCHGGRSRTALILKAWKMRRDGLDEAAAHDWLTSSWTHANRQNSSFVDFLTNEWPKIIESHPRG
jgi:ADP-ribosyl-[dinitrogen reductase] hydrolase